MVEHKEQLAHIEMVKAMQAFHRYASAFETYQRLYREAKDVGDDDSARTLRERMRALHIDQDAKALEDAPNEERPMFESNIALAEFMLSICESGTFSKDSFASALLQSDFGRTLIEKWQPKSADYTEPDGKRVFVNDSLNYYRDDVEGTQISVHLEPVDSRDPREIIQRIEDGLRVIANKMKSGEIAAQQVSMRSWLLKEQRAKRLFGDNVDFRIVESPNDARPALTYDAHALERYLKKRKLPYIGSVMISRDEFVRRFAN